MPDPRWLKLAVTGEWNGHPKKPYQVTPDDLISMADYFNAHYRANSVDLVVDFEHQSLHAASSGEKAPASGWISQLELRDSGRELWGLVAWTDQAAALINSREYRYLSPVFRFNIRDAESGDPVRAALDSVALTNRPFITRLPAVANSSDTQEVTISQHVELPSYITLPSVANSSDSTDGINQVALEQEQEEPMELLTKLATALGMEIQAVADLLGIAQDAGDDDALKAVASKLVAEVPNSAAVADLVANSLGVEPTVDLVRPALAALKAVETDRLVIANSLGLAADAKTAEIVAGIQRLQQGATADKAESLIANAVSSGKIAPANKEHFLKLAQANFAETETLVNSLPTLISAPYNAGRVAPDTAGNLTDQEKTFANSLGVAESDMAEDKAAFANSADLRGEFPSIETYLAFRAAERQGRTRIVGAKSA